MCKFENSFKNSFLSIIHFEPKNLFVVSGFFFKLKGSFSCKWVKKSISFFHHYSIAYAFRNTHVKFQAGIRKIVEVINFLSRYVRPPVFGTKNFKRVFLETMFFKLACTITKEQLDMFQKFLYRIKLYSILNRITSRKM